MTILTATELSVLVEPLLPVATLADLRELAAPDNQAHVEVQGGTAAGDGDGGTFWYDSSNSTADDGVDYIKPDGVTGAGRWRRIRNDADVEAGAITNAEISASAAIALSKLATQAAYTVVANNTGSSAVPTAVTTDALVVSDSGGYYDQTTLAGQLQEVRSDLAATSTGNGASLVGVEDAAGNFTGTDVEAVLAELAGGAADALSTSGADVDVSAASPPTSGQVLTATSATTATWQTPAPDSFTVTTVSDATSITPNVDTSDVVHQTNTQATGTLTINAPTGTPADTQRLYFRIKSTNAQTFSWNATYRGSSDLPLPAVTAAGSTTIYVGFWWNATDSKWDILGKNDGF